MNIALYILILFAFFGNDNELHEFHVSKCLVEYKAEKQEIQISMNIFIDDLELALQTMGIDSLYIGTEKEASTSDIYINKYLARTFQLDVNEMKKMEWQFIGKEISEDLTSIWCYMRIEAKEDLQKIYIKNSVLLETYEDQKNITNIIGPNNSKTSFLSSSSSDDKTITY